MRFIAELEKAGEQNQWTIVRMPFDAGEVFGSRGIIKVRATVNRTEFETSLFPRKGEPHFMMVSKAMQKSARLRGEQGERVEIELAVATPRKVEMPPALSKVFAHNKRAAAFFKTIPPSWQRARIDRVAKAKTDIAKQRAAYRVATYLNELEAGLKKLPAPLEAAMSNRPAARAAFAKLAPSHKKMYIGWVVDAATDEARQRRAEKIVKRLFAPGLDEWKAKL
jgi:uncharacterized protein YdeI (YjbR/CyaY-like superfamily)